MPIVTLKEEDYNKILEFIQDDGSYIEGDTNYSHLETIVNKLNRNGITVNTSDLFQRQASQPPSVRLFYSGLGVANSMVENIQKEDIITKQRKNADIIGSNNILDLNIINSDLYPGADFIVKQVKSLVEQINTLYNEFNEDKATEIKAAILKHLLTSITLKDLSTQIRNELKEYLDGK